MRRTRAALALVAALSLALACAGPPPADEGGLDPGVAPVVRRAEVAAQSGDYTAAIAAYGEALERTPWNTRFERLLAVSHAERAAQQRAAGGRDGLAAAAADLRRAREIDPGDPTFGRNLAVVLVELARLETEPELAAAARAEAAELDPELVAASPHRSLGVERRLDLAFELIGRGQLAAGVRRLEALHADHPGRADVARLLAQALVRLGDERAEHRNYPEAGGAYTRAVDVYDGLAPCDGARCTADELRAAHYNRLVALIEQGDRDAVRAALARARARGLRFPGLESAARR